jgi:imidazolonepropionase-like amidohydrolase
MPLHLHGRMLPGDHEVDCFVDDDGRFSFTPIDGARTVARDAFLIPGLVDAHTHLGINSPAGDGASEEEQVRASARAELAAGVLALREPGSPNRASRGLGPSVGLPTTITAGRFLTRPGGYFKGLAREVPAAMLADAAAEELAQSDGWVKVIGDFLTEEGVLRPNFDPGSLAAAVHRVHEAGGRVAVHCAIRETIDAAVAAGVDSVEHGTGMTQALLERMLLQQITWVPTMIIFHADIAAFLHEMGASASEVARMTESAAQQPAMVRAAHEAGIRVLAGTDAGMVEHGLIAQEIHNLCNAGLSAEAALAAASWDARDFLGLQVIEDGAPADLIAYARDPRSDLGVLAHPELVLLHGIEIPRR